MSKPHHFTPQAWLAYRAHRNNANRRGIPFLFTPDEWWNWWQANGWNDRGMGADRLVMARHNDSGPYSPDNVSAITHRENMLAYHQLMTPERKLELAANMSSSHAARVTAGTHHLQVRGDAHPKSKPVMTPTGRYANATLAGEAYGITRQAAGTKARLGKDGWSYL